MPFCQIILFSWSEKNEAHVTGNCTHLVKKEMICASETYVFLLSFLPDLPLRRFPRHSFLLKEILAK